MRDWREWLCHSNFSFLTGASSPLSLVDRALELGYKGLGFCDYDGVYGLARAHRSRLKLQGADRLKLFYGAEIHLAPDHDLPVTQRDTLVLYALTLKGYGNLCQILTHAHRHGKRGAFVTPKELLTFAMDDVIGIQPMRGLIRRTLSDQQKAAWMDRLRDFNDHFARRFYLAVSRHLSPSEDAWITPTLALAKALGCHVLMSQDAYMHKPEEKDLSDVLQAIRLNCTVDGIAGHAFANDQRCLLPRTTLHQRYRSLPIYERALNTSAELAACFDFEMTELRYRYPKEMLPAGISAQDFLEKITWEHAKALYGDPLPDKLVSIINREIQLVSELGFADYFLTVWDIVRWARSQHILCQGRGSAANSAVCYVLGITAVDPLGFDGLFERFISAERGDPPDIDVDFEHERREEVIQYIYERYGRHKAAMVANVIQFKTRGSLRSAGLALGVPEVVLSQAARLLDSRAFRSEGISGTVAYLYEEHGKKPELANIQWELWGQLAERLKGFPRHLGIHSGGFVLADAPLNQLIPQEPATMEGRTVIQWCKEDIEALGFFKIDILALGILTAMRKCFALIDKHYDRQLTLANIPADDRPTYAMIQKADTVGTFQIESRAQMSMLPRLKPNNYYDLVIEVAIIRPGPIQGGMIHPYLKRRNGLEPVTYPDPRLKKILHRTLGIPIFQEQVMRIAIEVGGFSGGEADELRRNMGTWSFVGDLQPLAQKLADGMRKNGLKEEFIEALIRQLGGFAHYGFPESHAASFALIAYASSYLKRHHPAAFFAALLNSQPMGFYTPHVLLQAAKQDGVKLLPVSAEDSDWDCTLEGHGAPALRLGMRLVRSLSETGAKQLMNVRRKLGGFDSYARLLQNARLGRDDLTALAAANALHVYGMDRRSAVWTAEAAPFTPLVEDVEGMPYWETQSEFDVIQQDFLTTGTTLGRHPVTVIRENYWCFKPPTASLTLAQTIKNQKPNTDITVFGMVIVRQSPPTAKGMVFLTLEDETGFFNLVFHPPVFQRFHKLIDHRAFLCVTGKLQAQSDLHSILVKTVHPALPHAATIVPMPKPRDDHGEPDPRVKPRGESELVKSRNYM